MAGDSWFVWWFFFGCFSGEVEFGCWTESASLRCEYILERSGDRGCVGLVGGGEVDLEEGFKERGRGLAVTCNLFDLYCS